MVQFNHSSRELTIKVVYYGSGLSGKTTNLQQIHQRVVEGARGRLLTLDTANDRTLFFDLVPVFFQTRSGLKVKLNLYTVPGQVIHDATRRVVLQGADGVVFVADSRRSCAVESNEYWLKLAASLRDNGFAPGEVPVVIQLNKLDLPGARTPEEIDEVRGRGGAPVFGAVAIRGEGVIETLHGLLERVYRQLDARLGLRDKLQLSERDLLGQVFSRVKLDGTRLEGLFPRSGHE